MDVPSDIYTDELFGLVANSPSILPLDDAMVHCARQAKLCGSKIAVDINLDKKGAIVAYGHKVEACLLGQTSAAIVAKNAVGLARGDIETVRKKFSAMLKTGKPIEAGPWQELNYLLAAQSYVMRHGSMLLVFDALLCAFDEAQKNVAKSDEVKGDPQHG